MTSLLTSCVKCFLFRILRGSEISRKSATPHNFGRNDGERNYVGGSGGTICTQIVHDTWEELLKDAEASRKESMCMIRLWNTLTVVWCYRKDVAVKNRDLVKEIG